MFFNDLDKAVNAKAPFLQMTTCELSPKGQPREFFHLNASVPIDRLADSIGSRQDPAHELREAHRNHSLRIPSDPPGSRAYFA